MHTSAFFLPAPKHSHHHHHDKYLNEPYSPADIPSSNDEQVTYHTLGFQSAESSAFTAGPLLTLLTKVTIFDEKSYIFIEASHQTPCLLPLIVRFEQLGFPPLQQTLTTVMSFRNGTLNETSYKPEALLSFLSLMSSSH